MKTVNYEAIERYIFECIDFSDYPIQPITNGEKIAYLLETCKNDRRHNSYKSNKHMFIEWCYGLPSCFNMAYQQYKVVELCANFGLKTPKKAGFLFDVWYGNLYESVNYLNNKLNK